MTSDGRLFWALATLMAASIDVFFRPLVVLMAAIAGKVHRPLTTLMMAVSGMVFQAPGVLRATISREVFRPPAGAATSPWLRLRGPTVASATGDMDCPAEAVTSGIVRSGPAMAGPRRVRPGHPRGGRPRGGDDRRVTVAPAAGSYRGFGSGSLPRRAPAALKAKIIGTSPRPLR